MWIHLLPLGLIDGGGDGAAPEPPPVVTQIDGGVRRSRFLRRGPRLPWEHEDEPAQVVRVEDRPKRRRIKLPKEVIETVQDAMPVQAYVEMPLPRVVIPDVPVVFDDDDDDDLLLMI